MSHYDERGLGQSRAGQNPLADFDALRARRMAEQEADGYEATAPVQAPEYDRGYGYGYEYGNEPTRLVGGVTPPAGGRGKLRSTVVFVGMVVLVVGLGAGVYAATRPSGGTQATAAVPPAMAPSASASSGAGNPGMMPNTDASPTMSQGSGMGMGTGMGGDGPSAQPSQMPKTTARGTLMMLSVIDVGNGSFTATTTRGATVTVQITSQTQFGSQAQPFAPSDLVPGAVVWARIRRDPDGDGNLQATLIAAAGMNDQAAQASPTGGTGN